MQTYSLGVPERACFEALIYGSGFRFTSQVQHSWCARRALNEGLLTLSILRDDVRERLLADWSESPDNLLDFIASQLPDPSAELAVCRFEQLAMRAYRAAATFKAVSDPSTKEFHDRDLYVFIYDMSGVCVAHGARPALIGKNLIDIKDQDGNYLIRRMVEIANGAGSGWVDYKWPNPQTNKIEDKSSYVEKLGDYFAGVGVYRQ